jgi:hypothetical protein
MKKIYVKPATEVYEVEVQNVIATSPGSIGISTNSASKDAEVDADERSSWGSLW